MRKLFFAALATSLFLSPAALAQNNNKIDAGGGKGLVVVDLTQNDVDVSLLDDLDITGNTVQVPITVAAILCGQEVYAIASTNNKGDKSCDATVEGVQNFATSQ